MQLFLKPREAVRRKATGMTPEQIREATAEAAAWERQRSRVCETRDDEAAIQAAIDAYKEWRRIGCVMTEENLAAYDPDRDPTVQRWRREDQLRARTQLPITAPCRPAIHRPPLRTGDGPPPA